MDAMMRVIKLNQGRGSLDVPVRIFWPVDDKTAWSCQWEIQWPGRTRANVARGVDAVQALIHALQMVGSELYCCDAHEGGLLSWTSEWRGYGFPVPPTLRDNLKEDDRELF